MPSNFTQEAIDTWTKILTDPQEFGYHLTMAPADVDSFVAELYSARKHLADPRLEVYAISKFKGGVVYIVKKEVSLEDDNATPLT